MTPAVIVTAQQGSRWASVTDNDGPHGPAGRLQLANRLSEEPTLKAACSAFDTVPLLKNEDRRMALASRYLFKMNKQHKAVHTRSSYIPARYCTAVCVEPSL